MKFRASAQSVHFLGVRVGKTLTVVGATLFALGLSTGRVRAGDLSPQPTDNLPDRRQSERFHGAPDRHSHRAGGYLRRGVRPGVARGAGESHASAAVRMTA